MSQLRSEIKDRMDAVYGDSSSSMATVTNWFNEFQRGRTSVLMSHAQELHKVLNHGGYHERNQRSHTGRPPIEGARGHILHYSLGMRKLPNGAAFTYSGQQAQP